MIRLTILDRGEVSVRHLNADQVPDFRQALEARGGSVLEAKAESGWSRPFRRAPKPEAWVPWFSALARTLKGGVPLHQSLALLAEAAPEPAQVTQVQREVISGRRFSEAVGSHFAGLPDLIPALLRAGEAAGDLAQGVALSHQTLQDLAAFRRELTARLAYPLVVVSSSTLAVLVLLLKVFPAMSGMWENLGKPLPPRLIVIHVLGWVGLAALATLAVGLAWVMGGGEKAQRLPGFRTLGRHRQRAEAWSALAMALSGGVSLLEALDLLGHRWGAKAMHEAIRRGVRPEVALAGWVDDAPGQRAVLSAGLQIGDLAGGARSVAEGYRDLLAQDLQKLQRRLEPAVLVLLGGILMGLAWGLFSLMGEMEHGLVR